jgi:glycosyltransferase involved in cell wall biosynthesis
VKVLHVISSVDPRGGGPIEGVFSSSAVWSKHGHERYILSLDTPNADWVAKAPVKTFAVGIESGLYAFLRRVVPWFRYGYSPHLTRWLKIHARSYDAIIVNGLWNYASYGSWRALHKLDTPYFVFTHGMLDPWFNKTYPIKSFFKAIFWKLFEHKVLRDARCVLFTSEEERELAPRGFKPYNAKGLVVGYGTRDPDGDPEAQRAAFLAQVPDIDGRKFMLYLSRIHPKKGVDILIHAFARQAAPFAELDLVIAGPDQIGWKSDLQKIARKLGVGERIHWPGMLLGDSKWGAFRSAEFFVLPSHQENFGIVVAEAMALSKPVLITNKVNIWREVEADGAGLVVNDDVEAIADGLQKMSTLCESQLEAIGQKARKCFLARYNLERNAIDLLRSLERLSAALEISEEDVRPSGLDAQIGRKR